MRRLKAYVDARCSVVWTAHTAARCMSIHIGDIIFWIDGDEISYTIKSRSRVLRYFHSSGVFANRIRESGFGIARVHTREFDPCIVGCTLYTNVNGRECKYHMCDRKITFNTSRSICGKYIGKCRALNTWHILYARRGEIIAMMKSVFERHGGAIDNIYRKKSFWRGGF